MYNQSAKLPIILQVNEGIIDQVPYFLERNKLQFQRPLVVSGKKFSNKYSEIVSKSLKTCYTLKSVRNTQKDEAEIARLIKSEKIDFVIAVGGGYILDLVKRITLLENIENLLIPTVISNDGLISPIAVIQNESGKSVSLPGKMPMGIVVDLDIIAQAPKEYIQAAAGDILSNISATNDWIIAHKNINEPINDVAYSLSRNSAYSLLQHESKDLKNRGFIKQIISCQINSGLAMSLAGTSRPCSGSEHLISHAIDYLGYSKSTLHGLQVGSISIFSLYLQNKLDAKCLNYAYELGIPYSFDAINPEIESNITQIYKVALDMRPGRNTILNNLTPDTFASQYREFKSFLKKFK